MKLFDLKNGNLKLKLLSLAIALFLWMYVMAVIDPEESKKIVDMPVSITNMSTLDQNDLVIYPNKKLTTDIVVRGKLSDIQKLNNENVHITGEIKNPIEGRNEVSLKTNISGRISQDFINDSLVVNLEKQISENFKIELEGENKDTPVKITPQIQNVIVTGPRSQVKAIAKIMGKVKTDSPPGAYNTNVKLYAYNDKGKIISSVKIQESKIQVFVVIYKEKTVAVNPVKSPIDDSTYVVNPKEITVFGPKEVVDAIQKIDTATIVRDKISNETDYFANLIIPNGIGVKGDIKAVRVDKK